MRQFLIVVILSAIALLCLPTMPILAADLDNGAKIFSVNCAGCHPHGGNIIRRGKNLKERALHRNKLDSVDAIAYLVANGKNNMSAYRDRLSQQEIQDVAAYVLAQAKNNWR
jgi:cytochrome c6